MLKLKKKAVNKYPHRCCAVTITEEVVTLVSLKQNSLTNLELSACRKVLLDNPGDYGRALAELITQHELRDVPCAWVLQPSQYNLLQIDALEVPAEELNMAVRWRIKDLIDFPHREAAVDAFNIPAHGVGQRRKLMYVTATRLPFLQQHVAVLRDLGLYVAAIDVEILAMRNIINALALPVDSLALLSLLPDGAEILIFHHEQLYLVHRINLNMREVDLNQRNILDALVLELQRAFDYFVSEMNLDKPSCLLLTPTVVECYELLRSLETFFQMPVKWADVSPIFQTESVDLMKQADCYAALGGVLRLARHGE